MKKLLIIYPDYSEEVTGGQVYDKMFFKTFLSNKEVKVDFLLDEHLFSQNKFLFIFSYLLKLGTCCRYDYILTNSRLYTRLFVLWSFLRIFGIKIYSIHHHFNFEGERGLKKLIHKTLELYFLYISSATLIPSPYIKDRFTSLLKKSKYIYIPLGVKKSENKCNGNREIGDVVDLLYVGTIERRKGLLYLVNSLSLLKKKTNRIFRCHIVGKTIEEYYKLQIERQIVDSDLNENVIFHGRLSNEELDKLYNDSDIFVFPSMLEGYGMVLLEAMSYSLPIVAFNNSAMPYTVKTDINGLLVKNKDIEEFCDAIIKLMDNSTYYSRLVCNAKAMYDEIRTEEDVLKDMCKCVNINFVNDTK